MCRLEAMNILFAIIKYCMFCIPVWIGTRALILLKDAGDERRVKSNPKHKRYRVVKILVSKDYCQYRQTEIYD